MNVVELHSWNERPDIVDQWQRLWEDQEGAPVFLHPMWAQTWWEHFGQGRALRLLLVERDGHPIALAPLFLERPFPAPGRLRIVGAGITSDYMDWLLPADPGARTACADLLFEYLGRRGGWLTLELQGLRPDSRLLALTERAQRPGLLVQPRPGPPSPAVQVQGTWDAYLASRPSSLRRNVRNRQRRLATLGEVSYRHADSTNAHAAVDEMIYLHDLRWTGRQDVTLVSRSARGQAFYRAVFPKLVEAGIADLVSLRLNGRAIATQAGFVVGDVYYGYQVAFDPDLSKYGPSTLLLVYLLERAWSTGLKTVDFMTGAEPYKYRWADHDPTVSHVTIVPNQIVARALLRAMEIGRRIRRRREAAHAEEIPTAV